MAGAFASRFLRRSWPFLASFGINGALIALLLNLPQRSLPADPDTPDIIPVTLVEQASEPPEAEETAEPREREPDQEPAPEPDPPPLADPEPLRPLALPATETPTPSERTPVQSPVIAAPGETADAGRMAGGDSELPELDLPILAGPQARTRNALRGLSCNRLGKERPAWCDDGDGDVLEAVAKPGFAEDPTMAPKEWAEFEIPQREEWCPQSDGVIRDVVIEDQNPYRQGAAAAVGTLARSFEGGCSE